MARGTDTADAPLSSWRLGSNPFFSLKREGSSPLPCPNPCLLPRFPPSHRRQEQKVADPWSLLSTQVGGAQKLAAGARFTLTTALVGCIDCGRGVPPGSPFPSAPAVRRQCPSAAAHVLPGPSPGPGRVSPPVGCRPALSPAGCPSPGRSRSRGQTLCGDSDRQLSECFATVLDVVSWAKVRLDWRPGPSLPTPSCRPVSFLFFLCRRGEFCGL